MSGLSAILLAVSTLYSSFEYRTPEYAGASVFLQALPPAAQGTLSDNPATVRIVSGLYGSAGISNPYDLFELESYSISAGYGVKWFGTQITWKRFGLPGYYENRMNLALAFGYREYISFGLSGTWYYLQGGLAGFTGDFHAGDFSLGIYSRPVSWLRIGITGENFLSLFMPENKSHVPFTWSVGAGVQPVKGLEILWNGVYTFERFVNRVEVTAVLLKEFSVSLSYTPEIESYSFSARYHHRHFTASYGFSHHSVLGYTHRFSITLGTDLKYPQSLLSFSEEKKKVKLIDIQTATEEELQSLREISKDVARRIVLYRKKIGPVTEEALVQMGMTEKEVQGVKKYIKGLAKRKKKSYKKYNKRKSSRKVKKDHFKEYLQKGLSPGDALNALEACRKGDKESFEKIISSYRESVKKEVRSLCR
jgi:DNA uptake protein ComE-like DNA-binding protein